MTNATRTAEQLLEIGAVKLRPEAPYTWASGWKSPIYCDNRKILSFPYVRDFIKSELSNLVWEKYNDAELIAGVATAGIAWGALVADQLKLPFIYVRPKPKEHGLGNQIEGFYEAGQKVVVVEDLISTGKSSLQVVDVLRAEMLKVEGMVSIFNYGFDAATDALEKANTAFQSLTDYKTLLEAAVARGAVSPDILDVLLNWRTNPAEWAGSL